MPYEQLHHTVMQAYTYSILHRPSGRYYYGVRKSSIDDIGVFYFSSSRLVLSMIEHEDRANFKFQVRRRFDTYTAARAHEVKFLKRVKAVTNPVMLNMAITSPRVCFDNKEAEDRRKRSLSNTMTALWATEEYRRRQNFHVLSTDEASRRGTIGALARANNYLSGKTVRKSKKKVYRDVLVQRDGIQKSIKANQVSAYQKCGWKKVQTDDLVGRSRIVGSPVGNRTL